MFKLFLEKAEEWEIKLPTSAAAAAKSLQSCLTLCDPLDGSPPGSPRPWDSPGKNTAVSCHFLLQCMKVKSESEVAQLCPNIHWIMEKAREFQKNIYFCFIDNDKAFDCVDHNQLWKILKEMGIPDLLTCLLRNLYAGQEASVRTEHGTIDWFQIEKEYVKTVYCHPAYLTYMQSTSWEMLGWKKHKLESSLPGEISITSDMQMTPPLSRKWRGTKKPLDESERWEWKSWLKAQHSEN